MRIAVDARPLSVPLAGIGRYTNSLLAEMARMGHEWFLYSDSAIDTQLSSLDNVTIRSGKAKPSSATGLYYSQGAFRFWLKKDAPDLFWSPRHHLPLRLNKNIPQVLTIHDVVWKRYPETMPIRARMLERLLMPAAIKQADKIICVSQFTATEISRFWPTQVQKVEIIPLGTLACGDVDNNDDSTLEPYILFVGTLEPRKNLHRLLGAFSKLVNEKRITENLVIVGGKGWGGADLSSLLRVLKLEGRVSLTGFIDDFELHQLYRGARCLVMPSLYEGFGLPVLEAMQFGIPVIVSETGALPEITGNAGLFIDPKSENSIARAIELLMNDESLYARLSEQAAKQAVKFSWSKAARKTLDVFLNVAKLHR